MMKSTDSVEEEDEDLVALSKALNNLILNESGFKAFLKEKMNENEFENMIPFIILKDLEYNGIPVSQYLYSNRADSSLTLEFFQNQAASNFPTLAIFIKVDLEDEDEDEIMSEQWVTTDDVQVAFESNVENYFYALTEEPEELASWEKIRDEEDNDIIPAGNILFWSSFESMGYILVDDQLQTFSEVDNPFEVAHNYTYKTTLFEEECEEARTALAAFLTTSPPSGGLWSTLGWIVHANVLNGMVNYYCEYLPSVSNNGGDVFNNCDRNDRNFSEQITKIQVPNKNDRSKSGLRRWDNGFMKSRGYKFVVTYLAITGTASNPALGTGRKVFTVTKEDLKDGNEKSLVGLHIDIIRWRLDVFADAMKYSWLADANLSTTKITYGTTLNGQFTFQSNGVNTTTSTNTNFSVTTELDSKSRDAGESMIYYCDAANGSFGKFYSTGSVKFWVRERYD